MLLCRIRRRLKEYCFLIHFVQFGSMGAAMRVAALGLLATQEKSREQRQRRSGTNRPRPPCGSPHGHLPLRLCHVPLKRLQRMPSARHVSSEAGDRALAGRTASPKPGRRHLREEGEAPFCCFSPKALLRHQTSDRREQK